MMSVGFPTKINYMEKYYAALSASPLFAQVDKEEIETLLNCLSAVKLQFRKNRFIFLEGERAESFGVVLSGAVHVLCEDFWGRRKILARVEPGGLFGESFAYAGTGEFPVSVMAAGDSVILLVNNKSVVSTCRAACTYHTKLIKNLALILAEKNVALTQKLEHITQPTTREKLMSYLSEQARFFGTAAFDIPFNREELADYLSVERSAMSAELSKMRKDGLLIYQKNHFELLK